MNMLRLCPSCCARECPPDRTVCEKCYPRVAECKQLQQELESTADKLSNAWLLLDDIARGIRDSNQTRQAAVAMLMAQQAPGWKGKLVNVNRTPEPRYCGQCGSDHRGVDSGGVCWKCREDILGWGQDQYDGPTEEVEDVMCPACGGTGEAPDNGTNMGECDECCGSGLMA